MIPAEIVFEPGLIAALKAAAEAAFPNECCGLLVGSGEERAVVEEVLAMPNTAAEPSRRFEIDPQRQFDLLRRLRSSSRRVIGHFHSHPNGSADLSRHDLSMAFDPTAVWTVVPLSPDGRAADPVAFVCPGPDRAVSVPVVVSGGERSGPSATI